MGWRTFKYSDWVIFTETSFLTSDIGDNKELAKISNNFFYNNKTRMIIYFEKNYKETQI